MNLLLRTLRALTAAALVALGVLTALSEREARAQQLQLNPQLQNNLRYVQIGMSAGRVTATSSYSGRNFSSTSQSNDRQESLRVDMNGTSPSIDYQLTTKTLKLTVELIGGTHLKIQRRPLEGSDVKPFELDQPGEGKITVVLGDAAGGDATVRRWQADSLWQFFIAEPDLAKTELEPLLRLLRPGWSPATHAKAIEEALYTQVDTLGKFDRQEWSALVAQLASPKYIEREEADRKLRELGQSIVPYLKNLNPGRLDAEQTFRIRAIARRYETEESDEQPEAAASWLAADPEVWHALAGRATSAQRPLVRTQLERILGEPVVLDADAAGEKLQEQLQQIREQIDKRRAGE